MIEAQNDNERKILAIPRLSAQQKETLILESRKVRQDFEVRQAKRQKEMDQNLKLRQEEVERLKFETKEKIAALLTDMIDDYHKSIQKIREEFERKTGQKLPPLKV